MTESERNIVAAILSSSVAAQLREEGQSFELAAEHAVMMYNAILRELAKSEAAQQQRPGR